MISLVRMALFVSIGGALIDESATTGLSTIVTVRDHEHFVQLSGGTQSQTMEHSIDGTQTQTLTDAEVEETNTTSPQKLNCSKVSGFQRNEEPPFCLGIGKQLFSTQEVRQCTCTDQQMQCLYSKGLEIAKATSQDKLAVLQQTADALTYFAQLATPLCQERLHGKTNTKLAVDAWRSYSNMEMKLAVAGEQALSNLLPKELQPERCADQVKGGLLSKERLESCKEDKILGCRKQTKQCLLSEILRKVKKWQNLAGTSPPEVLSPEQPRGRRVEQSGGASSTLPQRLKPDKPRKASGRKVRVGKKKKSNKGPAPPPQPPPNTLGVPLPPPIPPQQAASASPRTPAAANTPAAASSSGGRPVAPSAAALQAIRLTPAGSRGTLQISPVPSQDSPKFSSIADELKAGLPKLNPTPSTKSREPNKKASSSPLAGKTAQDLVARAQGAHADILKRRQDMFPDNDDEW